MNACQSPRTVYPASNLPVQKRGGLTTISWIGCLARSSCACRSVWRAAATLPQQPCSRSGACHTVHPAGHGDARTYFIIKLYCRARITISGAITRWIGCLARSRVASFGVRQHGCRASRTHDLARATSLTRLVTRRPGVLVTNMESSGNE